MLSAQVQYMACGLVALAGLLAILFGLVRGGRVRARLPFMLGGLALLAYGVSFAAVLWAGRLLGVVALAEATGRASEGTELIQKLVNISGPVSFLEPIGVWLLVLGFGAIARNAAAGAPAAVRKVAVPSATPAEPAADSAGPDDETYPFDE